MDDGGVQYYQQLGQQESEKTVSKDIQYMLSQPFAASSISWRAGATNKNKTPDKKPSKCIALAYIDARDVMRRLDDVFGMQWECHYTHADKKTICEIRVLVDGVWISRANGAGDSDIEAEKGAISDAFKRAAVMFGIGRYLYDLPNVWVECDEWGHIKSPPALPKWALPTNEPKPAPVSTFRNTHGDASGQGDTGVKHVLDAPANEMPTPERMESLKEIAAEIVDFHTKGMFDDAFVVYDNVSDMSERNELWKLLQPNSGVRSKLKLTGEEKRKANGISQ